MQPRGFGIPAMRAAIFAGPLGKSWYSSLIDTPDALPSTRTVGPVPFSRYSLRMKRMICQCRSVRSMMPSNMASAGTMASVHCSGSKKNPSSLRAMSVRSTVAVVILFSSLGSNRYIVFACDRHVRRNARDRVTWQERVPVEPLKHQLAEVIEMRLFQQRQANPGWVMSGQRLGLVVEIDQHGLTESGLDEAVGVAVVAGIEVLAGEKPANVLAEHLTLEVGDRPCFGNRQTGSISDREDLWCNPRLQRVLIGWNEA